MLRKTTISPGVLVEVNPVIKDGLPVAYGGDNKPKPYLELLESQYQVKSGERLEVVKGPRRVPGWNNVIRVRVVGTDIESEAYWCEVRASCTQL